MPKSKKNKIVHLTQVKKKGKDHKEDLMKQVEGYIKQYEYVYVFDFDATKSDRIMNLRLKMKPHGAIFAGRNSLVSQAMKSIGSKTRTNYKKFLKHITGHRGLLFTNLPCDKLLGMLEANSQEFRDKLLGYAPLKAGGSDTVAAAAAASEDDDDSEDDEQVEEDENPKASKRAKKPMSNIRFLPIKKMPSKKNKSASKKTKGPSKDADGDVVLADEAEAGDDD